MLKLFILLLSVSCSTYQARQSTALLKNAGSLETKVTIKDVPFIKQKENYCGPATLGMMLNFKGYPISMDKLAKEMYTAKQSGSFPTDVISTARRHGFLAVPIGDLKSILTEVSSTRPVMVFQNLGLKQLVNWHYSVVVGYDLAKETVILHSGPDKFKKVNIREFERTWDLAGQWSIVVLRPGELSSTADDLAHVTEAAALEQLGKLKEAEITYQAILQRWNDSLGALIGMGNITFNRNEFQQSVTYLSKASNIYPNSAIVWHNLAIAQKEASQNKEAKFSSLKAISLAEDEQKIIFQENLKEIIK